MYFDIQRRAFYSIEGRILLRTSLMIPGSVDSVRQSYIFEFVKTCESFANEILFPSLLQMNASNYNIRENRSAYYYDVTVDEIFSTDFKASYVILSLLKFKGEIISSGIKTISFYEDKIIPASVITRKLKYRKSPLIFDSEGRPSVLSFINGHMQINPI